VAPVAAFSGTPTSGSAPLTVNFTDASTNAPTTWAWDFQNDGIVDSSVQNPAFTYASPGTYSVKLTASNTAGPDDEVKTGYVTVGAGGSLTFVTFTPEADAFVNQANLTKNYGLDVNLRVNNSTTDYRSYLKFTTSGLAGPVGSAHLRLFVNDTSPDGGSVYAVSSGWTETGITWNTAPVLPPSPIRAIGATPAVGQWVDVDLGSAITGNGTFSFGIASNSTNSAFYSSLQGTNPPQLIVGYETGPPPPVAPVAQFTADTTSGAAPLTVQFTDTSSNTPTGWSWTFGDGGTSTEQSPSHQYTAAGTYTVSLTASNLGGSDDETKTGYITVYIPPVAEFSANDTSGPAPHTVQFTDASTNTPTGWSWAFGDGGTSTAQSPSHQYTAAGTYTVSLTATNPAGSDPEVKVDYITVTGLPGGTITVPPTADSRVS
jgi:PKD repeat protein